jgi:phosphoglycolate phosphatase
VTIKAILFDKDGTLVDFDATWGPAAYAVMRNLADGNASALQQLLTVSEYVEEERRFLPSSPLVAGSSAHYGPLWAEILGCESGPDFFTLMDDLFRVHGLASLAPIGDPGAVMRGLARRNLHLGIATNDSEASARAQAQALGIDGFMSYFAGYDSGHGSKPGPGMVTAFAVAHALHPAQVAMVGDSLHDLHSAKAAGAQTITVLSGPLGEGARAELAPFSDYILGSIAELEDLLDQLAANASPSAIPIS